LFQPVELSILGSATAYCTNYTTGIQKSRHSPASTHWGGSH